MRNSLLTVRGEPSFSRIAQRSITFATGYDANRPTAIVREPLAQGAHITMNASQNSYRSPLTIAAYAIVFALSYAPNL